MSAPAVDTDHVAQHPHLRRSTLRTAQRLLTESKALPRELASTGEGGALARQS